MDLGSENNAFAKGGNRLCFVDLRDSNRCVKVDRPDRLPSIRRKQSRFPKNPRALSNFDQNREDFEVIRNLVSNRGSQASNFIPTRHSFVNLNFGQRLVLELMRDSDQRVSVTLLQYVWENGLSKMLRSILGSFIESWLELGMPSRKLLLHNVVVQQSAEEIKR